MSAQFLAGQVAVVTGASRGIGRGAALALAQAGARVVLNYRSGHDEAASAVREIEAFGGQALALAGDVSNQGDVEALVATAAERFGHVDIAVSNAAYSDREAFYEADMAGFRRTVDVTMWGAFYLLRAAARQMIAQKGPASIVLVSSPHAYTPVPRAMAYNMSKAALDQMGRTAAIELAEFRIRVNMIHPGWIDTPGERKFASEETLAAAGAKLPLGRLGRPDEIGRGIAFLCDPANDYMTGSSLLIDGGITLPWWANRGSAAPD